MCSAPSSQKSAPAAPTRDARCIRFWWEISLYEKTTTSTEHSSIRLFEILLLKDRDAVRVQASSKHGRITAPGNIRNLRGSKSNHLVVEVLTKNDIEIVEVSARSSENENGFHGDLTALVLLCIFRFPADFCCAGNHGRV